MVAARAQQELERSSSQTDNNNDNNDDEEELHSPPPPAVIQEDPQDHHHDDDNGSKRNGTRMMRQQQQHRRMWWVFLAIVMSLIVSFGFALFVLEVILRPNWNRPASSGTHQQGEQGPQMWGVTDTVFTSKLDDYQFGIYVGMVLWITVVQTGLGTEYFVWANYLQTWTAERETLWRYAQFLFPLLVGTAVGLSLQGNFLCLPFIVVGLWKFGFPETIMYLYLGLFGKKNPPLQRTADLINGIGTVAHHGTSAFLICMLVTRVIGAQHTRLAFETSLVLIMQHWFVLLAYVNHHLYALTLIALEAWFEWAIISTLERLYAAHWTLALGGCVFILAHWLYVIAGVMEMFTTNSVEYDIKDFNKTNSTNAITRGTAAYHRRSTHNRMSIRGDLAVAIADSFVEWDEECHELHGAPLDDDHVNAIAQLHRSSFSLASGSRSGSSSLSLRKSVAAPASLRRQLSTIRDDNEDV